jgi:hypothetical protein
MLHAVFGCVFSYQLLLAFRSGALGSCGLQHIPACFELVPADWIRRVR